MTPQEAHELFSGYADGELNEEQSLRALEQMAADPANTKRVLHQQQLKQACGRIMDSQDMRCPDALRDKICSIANEHTQEQPAPTSASVQEHDSPVIGRIGQWLAPIAVAATLFIGALVALSVMNSNRGYHSDGILTASLAQTFGERHVKCSIGQSAPYDGQLFPAEIGQLDDSLVQHVGQELDGAALDLSTLGYEYKLAGFCPLPGDKSVHVMYENDKGQMLSLWIKAYDGKPTLDPGVPYIPPTDHTEQPMMVWREGDMVFYLVGDTMDDVKQAQPSIHLASAL
ncbi:hypothetical protein HNQ40_002040 [Algisphaera agarilytica]|uniref:Transmembrane transcriptional regulator (Anti-sigma factor RsiW) n=2 Tax=Algisphaera agarilytica TaxID=1385975 RepID=A0A7X0H6P0_9BACT|nr:hypothetical protein [Algisphaera agarilytica]